MKNNLKLYRFFSGKSQQQLAKELNVSQPKISGVERGFFKLKKEDEKKAAKILGYKVEQIFPPKN